jgi:hypothetical protein
MKPRVAAIILALVTFLAQTPLTATTFYILTFSDGIAVDGSCTLREAIVAARTDQPVDACAAGGAEDEIVLANTGTYSFGRGHERILDPRPAPNSRRDSRAFELYVIGMESANRFLQIDGGASVELRDLVLENGSALTGGENGAGGALRRRCGALRGERAVSDLGASMGGGSRSQDWARRPQIFGTSILEQQRHSGRGTVLTWGRRASNFQDGHLLDGAPADVLSGESSPGYSAAALCVSRGHVRLGTKDSLLERVRFVETASRSDRRWGTVEGVGISIWLDDYEGIDQMPRSE